MDTKVLQPHLFECNIFNFINFWVYENILFKKQKLYVSSTLKKVVQHNVLPEKESCQR